MNILFDSLELIYGSSEKPFFLTDQNGKVLWKNRRCGKTVIFTNGLCDRSKTEQVNIDGEVFSAVSREIDNNGKAYYLWEANTLSDILALLCQRLRQRLFQVLCLRRMKRSVKSWQGYL